jgi:LPXTG-motif cell wall-anchored protein
MRYSSARMLVAVAMGVLLLGMAAGLGQAATPSALAQPLPPRPTLAPPTSTPQQEHGGSKSRKTPTASPTGRITGTVIDLTTGAPAPGISVMVGDQAVISDANGNYTRDGLAAGSYMVSLALTASQGTPAQEPIMVEVPDGATVVQHLFFRSRPPAKLMPTLLPATPEPLPATPAAAPAPAALPNTGAEQESAAAWAWLGLILIGGGVALRMRKRSAR